MPVTWKIAGDYTDIIYEHAAGEAIAKITINRPEVRNAFRPHTVQEMLDAFKRAWEARESVVPALRISNVIPSPIDQNRCAQSRNPIDLIVQGWSTRLFQAKQQCSRMSA